MNKSNATPKATRVVTVPLCSAPISQLPPNRPLSVVLGEDEDVEWIWSPLPSGQQYISGYKVVKKSIGDEKR